MSLSIGFVRHIGPLGVHDPYYSIINPFESSQELQADLRESGCEDRVEAFIICEGEIADLLACIVSVNGEQDGSFLQQLEELLGRVYKTGRGRAMTDVRAIMQLEDAARQKDAHPAIRRAYHSE